MGIDDFLSLGQVALRSTILICAPILLISLIAGLAVSVFQAATQINDSALAFIPKIGALIIGIGLFGHFMFNQLAGFTTWVYSQIGTLHP